MKTITKQVWDWELINEIKDTQALKQVIKIY